MWFQLGLGAALIFLTIILGAGVWLIFESALRLLAKWFAAPHHSLRIFVAIIMSLMGVLAMITIGVWVWTAAFYALGLFETLEAALYFALVAFTTLGFGDVLLPQEYELLSGMAAANGLLIFGLVTALLVETMRAVRVAQRDTTDREIS